MGCFFSAPPKIKAESPPRNGLNSKDGGKEENDLSVTVSSSSMLLTPQNEVEILEASNLKDFAFNELRTATRNFRPDSMVGEGGFGSVFKGWIDEQTLAPTKAGTGMVIAVKRLNQESNQGHIEWLNYNAKLSDFGLAKYGPEGDKSHVSTRVMGTFGYAAPEYIATGKYG
ncbi:Protein kinase [Vigna unguiculata]|uniref:Protein kinase n=1 Tax=Vigna unguiculata TaxID=3917 RepID=A0A4D6LZ62_VIGUN|nr:Protein kinase [Vigna unguiculata]